MSASIFERRGRLPLPAEPPERPLPPGWTSHRIHATNGAHKIGRPWSTGWVGPCQGQIVDKSGRATIGTRIKFI